MTRKRIIAATAIVLLLTATAQAEQRTVYGGDGRVQSRITTDSGGATTVYDSTGKVQGRTSTDSSGTVTIYDSAGRKAGSVTTTGKSK